MGRLRRSDWAIVLVSMPVVAVTIAWLAALAVSATGDHPVWTLQPRNLAEAAAFRDGGTIVRGVWNGAPPSIPAEVRSGFISDGPVTLTPLEAGVDARRPEIVQLLFDLGATPDAGAWTRAWCRAEDAGVREVLARHRPADAPSHCGDDPSNR